MDAAIDDALARRGLTLVDVDGESRLRGPGIAATVRLDRATLHRVAEDGDVGDFLDALLARFRGLPDWLVARGGVRYALTAAGPQTDAVLHIPVSEQAHAVLAYTDPDEILITWLNPDAPSRWHTDTEQLHQIALANLDRLLQQTTLEIQDARGHQLGMLSIDSAFKGSLLLAPGLRALVEPALGWPVCAVVPCRDFLFLFADADKDALIPMLAAAVMTEYETSPYPVTNEVWRISDDGIEALGAYGDARG